MVLMRLRRLAGSVPAVARAAAVLGDGAALPAVAALAGLPEEDTATALATLARAEIVRDEQPLAFVHPLVREAVYRDLPAAERALRHERAAQVLRSSGATDEQVAAHLLRAPLRGDEETVAVLRRAARTAADRGASDSAVTLLRRALDEPPSDDQRRDLLLELGLLESLLDGDASTRHLLQAYALQDDPRTRADLAVAIARTHVFASEPGIATAFAREARRAVPDELPDHRQALLAIERISGYMHGLDPAIWRTAVPPVPVGEGDGARSLSATLAFEAMLEGTDRERAVALARFALQEDRLWVVDDGLTWIVAALVRMLSDDDLGDFWSRARAAAYARGSLLAVKSTSVWQGFWHWWRGELNEALACSAVALEQDRMWGGTRIGEPYIRCVEIHCRLDRGDVAGARAAADAAVAGGRSGEGARLVHLAVARLLAAEGRPEDALAALDSVPEPVPVPNPVWNPWRGAAATALHALGRTAEAVPLVEEEVRLLRRWGAPTFLGASLRLLGELRGRAGRRQLREAVDLLEPTPASVELARAQYALGSLPDVPDEEAVPLLRAACRTATRRGAVEVRDRVRAELQRRGCVDDTHPHGGRWLSNTERRIIDLAATGLEVRDIAQQLFLTPGTVRDVLCAAGPSASGDGLKSFSSPPPDRVSPENR